MATLRDIQRRITSVKNTQKITRAMKMVAASKLRRAQEAILLARPYAHRMRDLVSSLAQRAEHDAHPLLRSNTDEANVGLVVVTSDRGLCGSFNSNIVNQTIHTLRNELGGREVELTVVGKKGIELLKRRGHTIRNPFVDIQDGPPMEKAGSVIAGLVANFADENLDAVYCLYNEFGSAISQNITLERLLPFEPGAPSEGTPVDYIYEPSGAAVFDALLETHMQIQMHRILFESAASEHGARMTAMDSATNNAGDMIENLTVQYNRARQDAITTQLIEVVSGAEAL